MSNLEWFCTFIFNNPGARYSQIMHAFYEWRDIDPEKGKGKGWCSNYFNTGTLSPGYNGSLWKRIRGKKRTGYIICLRGLQYVREEVEPFDQNAKYLRNNL
tara:strand:+ start:184 stop:486 length:303 start_codon:yes stop_codon:yes gene_type:complete